MITPDSVIDSLGGTKAVASALSLDISTVSCWRESGKRKRGGGIPSAHWLPLVRLASERGVSGVTLEALADLGMRETVDGART